MESYRFTKMHGLGNDFVVLDARGGAIALTPAEVRALADRRTGVGCDQLITIEPSAGADVFMRIHNADGGEVAACGNATRCVGRMLMDETGRDRVVIETNAGLLPTDAVDDGSVRVDMGPARTDWQEIPLAREMDTLHLDLAADGAPSAGLADPVAVNVGNPHMVFFVADPTAVDLAHLGPMLEHHPLFPERANVNVAGLGPDGEIRLRVWERGVGITRACGTGACATLVAASRRQMVGRSATVRLDGGPLRVDWDAAGHVLMTGPVATSFAGVLDAGLLERAAS